MKVQWEESDIRTGRHVWRDMECMICGNPDNWRDEKVLVVLETGRIMTTGSDAEIAAYMTRFEYRPAKEK